MTSPRLVSAEFFTLCGEHAQGPLLTVINESLALNHPTLRWQALLKNALTPQLPFELHARSGVLLHDVMMNTFVIGSIIVLVDFMSLRIPTKTKIAPGRLGFLMNSLSRLRTPGS